MGEAGDSQDGFSMVVALTVFTSALRQRQADQRAGRDAGSWGAVCETVYGWSRARTYVAMMYVALLARATSGAADPHSLQLTSGPGGFSASSLWKDVIYRDAQGRLDLRNLKGAPFNNSPFYGKRVVSRDWENVSSANRATFEQLNDLLDLIGQMTRQQAAEALRDFLLAVPDAPEVSSFEAEAVARIDLPKVFKGVGEFLQDSSEGGRRGQAYVAACFGLIHGADLDTPLSVNDPSRTVPGDVRVLKDEPVKALAVEAKQKLVNRADVEAFAREVAARNPDAVTGYAALVNSEFETRSARTSLPSWREVLDDTGVLMALWDAPEDLLKDAIVFSGIPVTDAVSRFSALFAEYMSRLGVPEETLTEWSRCAEGFSVKLTHD